MPNLRSPTMAATAIIALAAGAPPLTAQTPDTASAIAALVELNDACERVASPWAVPLCGPFVLVDPSTRLAVADRPDPAGSFTPTGAAYVGPWPDEMPVANTAVQWEGEGWAMAMLPLRGDRFDRLRLLAHESFHRIQPELGHYVADPLATHLDEEDGRLWLRLELRALARALRSDGAAAGEAVADALLFRAIRHARFPGAAAIERQLEAHEGLAEYTGVRFALDATASPPERAADLVSRFENRPTYVRSLGYGTGPALGLLLDRYDPGWQDDVGDRPDLARRLARAVGLLGEPDAAASESLARERGVRYGLDEVSAEEGERAARIAELRDRYRRELVEGPVLVLELPERHVRFNPNTILALGEHGNVYPGAMLIGPWGRLTLEDGAALLSEDRDMARVAAPVDADAGTEGTVTGPGWTLELEPGWRLEPGSRPGDLRVVGPGISYSIVAAGCNNGI